MYSTTVYTYRFFTSVMNLYSLYVTYTEFLALPNDGCRVFGDYCFLIVPREGVGVVMHDGSVVVMRV